MEENLMASLRQAFESFIAREYCQDRDSKEEESRALREVLRHLEELGYGNREIMAFLGVEPLTVKRWADGKGMNHTLYIRFRGFVEKIISGKPQRLISVSDTGFVSSRYIFEQLQPQMERIWYLTSSPLLVSNSADIRAQSTSLYFAEKQKAECRPAPTLIYLYPAISMTFASMSQWKSYLEAVEQRENLRGTVIGIEVDTCKLPWFLPSMTVMLFEKDYADTIDVQGYIRIPMAKKSREEVSGALDPWGENQSMPWLEVEKSQSANWHSMCEAYFATTVSNAIATQIKEEKSFQIHLNVLQ